MKSIKEKREMELKRIVKDLFKMKRNNGKRIYTNIKSPNIPPSPNDIYVLTSLGDRLDSLAYQFYKDVRLWWIIANANPTKIRRDGFGLDSNIEIRIPANPQQILLDFEKENLKGSRYGKNKI